MFHLSLVWKPLMVQLGLDRKSPHRWPVQCILCLLWGPSGKCLSTFKESCPQMASIAPLQRIEARALLWSPDPWPLTPSPCYSEPATTSLLQWACYNKPATVSLLSLPVGKHLWDTCVLLLLWEACDQSWMQECRCIQLESFIKAASTCQLLLRVESVRRRDILPLQELLLLKLHGLRPLLSEM